MKILTVTLSAVALLATSQSAFSQSNADSKARMDNIYTQMQRQEYRQQQNNAAMAQQQRDSQRTYSPPPYRPPPTPTYRPAPTYKYK